MEYSKNALQGLSQVPLITWEKATCFLFSHLYHWDESLKFFVMVNQGSGNFDSLCQSFYQTLADIFVSILHTQNENKL